MDICCVYIYIYNLKNVGITFFCLQLSLLTEFLLHALENT